MIIPEHLEPEIPLHPKYCNINSVPNYLIACNLCQWCESQETDMTLNAFGDQRDPGDLGFFLPW